MPNSSNPLGESLQTQKNHNVGEINTIEEANNGLNSSSLCECEYKNMFDSMVNSTRGGENPRALIPNSQESSNIKNYKDQIQIERHINSGGNEYCSSSNSAEECQGSISPRPLNVPFPNVLTDEDRYEPPFPEISLEHLNSFNQEAHPLNNQDNSNIFDDINPESDPNQYSTFDRYYQNTFQQTQSSSSNNGSYFGLINVDYSIYNQDSFDRYGPEYHETQSYEYSDTVSQVNLTNVIESFDETPDGNAWVSTNAFTIEHQGNELSSTSYIGSAACSIEDSIVVETHRLENTFTNYSLQTYGENWNPNLTNNLNLTYNLPGEEDPWSAFADIDVQEVDNNQDMLESSLEYQNILPQASMNDSNKTFLESCRFANASNVSNINNLPPTNNPEQDKNIIIDNDKPWSSFVDVDVQRIDYDQTILDSSLFEISQLPASATGYSNDLMFANTFNAEYNSIPTSSFNYNFWHAQQQQDVRQATWNTEMQINENPNYFEETHLDNYYTQYDQSYYYEPYASLNDNYQESAASWQPDSIYYYETSSTVYDDTNKTLLSCEGEDIESHIETTTDEMSSEENFVIETHQNTAEDLEQNTQMPTNVRGLEPMASVAQPVNSIYVGDSIVFPNIMNSIPITTIQSPLDLPTLEEPVSFSEVATGDTLQNSSFTEYMLRRERINREKAEKRRQRLKRRRLRELEEEERQRNLKLEQEQPFYGLRERQNKLEKPFLTYEDNLEQSMSFSESESDDDFAEDQNEFHNNNDVSQQGDTNGNDDGDGDKDDDENDKDDNDDDDDDDKDNDDDNDDDDDDDDNHVNANNTNNEFGDQEITDEDSNDNSNDDYSDNDIADVTDANDSEDEMEIGEYREESLYDQLNSIESNSDDDPWFVVEMEYMRAIQHEQKCLMNGNFNELKEMKLEPWRAICCAKPKRNKTFNEIKRKLIGKDSIRAKEINKRVRQDYELDLIFWETFATMKGMSLEQIKSRKISLEKELLKKYFTDHDCFERLFSICEQNDKLTAEILMSAQSSLRDAENVRKSLLEEISACDNILDSGIYKLFHSKFENNVCNFLEDIIIAKSAAIDRAFCKIASLLDEKGSLDKL
ncbi:DgyrCDS14178 [Dimorphilus gyrociliatus]|uniref:DgyrCDS14178 n=1 Tax=Dimorphilus gyrociliatus TaxID=2664684 RepID=A0A7I8WCV2_9ANNE|nr:DgyrCDS14178 [Dimorphilus gyrociliatus]